ncbi:MAG: tripartite tricarboxylate transporter TctB family protein [Piscinibacter sp.]|uniref:tripartite tricarboxylate transporter TctB family protein n=1 Tax=Piscinibacter sp. TaxID=1903157 RepID=UPI00258810AD|nr:tripartite tricarboxylate transporter TctB family protein [Piscinibacter sp.]MCW5666416.1 tripartite tricarboxylate transporter TctB family protein [Piscinibacter sp.]
MEAPVAVPTARRLHQSVIGLGAIALGLAYAWGAIDIASEAGYGGVGPNFLPWLVALLLVVCGGLLLWQARHGGFENDEAPPGAAKGDWDALAWISAGVLLNAAAIERVGFVIGCALCFVFAVRGLRRAEGKPAGGLRGTALDFATGFLIAAPAYWLFTKLLAINLPGLTGTGWL